MLASGCLLPSLAADGRDEHKRMELGMQKGDGVTISAFCCNLVRQIKALAKSLSRPVTVISSSHGLCDHPFPTKAGLVLLSPPAEANVSCAQEP